MKILKIIYKNVKNENKMIFQINMYKYYILKIIINSNLLMKMNINRYNNILIIFLNLMKIQ